MATMTKKKTSTSPSQRPHSFGDFVCMLWFMLDAATHLFMEMPFLYYSFRGGAKNFEGLGPWIWQEYAKADKRWQERDSTIMSMEVLTSMVMGPIALALVYGVYYRKPWRHLLTVVLCVSELYGDCMTFFPEWIDGSPNLVTDTFKLKWFYLTFMNGVWVWVPIVLLCDSGKKIIDACYKSKVDLTDNGGVSNTWHMSNLIIICAYAVAVPAVILWTS